jgi:hypothetical protein
MRSYVWRGDTCRTSEPHFPHLLAKRSHVWHAHVLWSETLQELCDPKKPRLHVFRQSHQLGFDRFVKNLNRPRRHTSNISFLLCLGNQRLVLLTIVAGREESASDFAGGLVVD